MGGAQWLLELVLVLLLGTTPFPRRAARACARGSETRPCSAGGISGKL